MLYCDFCSKSQEKVAYMVAGPNGHAICDERCILSTEIIIDNIKRNIKDNKLSFKNKGDEGINGYK